MKVFRMSSCHVAIKNNMFHICTILTCCTSCKISLSHLLGVDTKHTGSCSNTADMYSDRIEIVQDSRYVQYSKQVPPDEETQ